MMKADGIQKRMELKRKAEQILARRGGKPSYMMIDPVYVIDLVNGYNRLRTRLGLDETGLFEEAKKNSPRRTQRTRSKKRH